MDTLTHIAIGAVTGELVGGKRFGKKAALWGAFLANIPDLDVLFKPLFSPAQSLLFHRGPSHAIIFCALLVPLLAYFINKIHKGNKPDFVLWMKIAAWCLASHLFTDCFNSYGTAIFYPFSNYRVSFDSIGIFDAFFILPLIIALICFAFLKRNEHVRKLVATSALLLSLAYLGFTVYNKLSLESKIKTELTARGIKYNRILTAPLPITNFVWLIIIEEDDCFLSANYSRPQHKVLYYKRFPKNYNLAAKYADDEQYKLLQRFSKGFYCITEKPDGHLAFCDLRFGSFDFDGTSGLENAVLLYDLNENYDGSLALKHQSPRRAVDYHRLRRYFRQAMNL